MHSADLKTAVLRVLASQEGRTVMSHFIDELMGYPELAAASRAAVVEVVLSNEGMAVVKKIAEEAAHRAVEAKTGNGHTPCPEK